MNLIFMALKTMGFVMFGFCARGRADQVTVLQKGSGAQKSASCSLGDFREHAENFTFIKTLDFC